MRRPRLLLALAVGAYLLTGLAQVRPEERGVVRRFGKVVARPHPGLWVGLPWGLDRVDRVPVRTARQVKAGFAADAPGTTPAGQFLTGDQNLVNVSLVIDYAIGETDRDLDDYVAHQDRVDGELAREAEAAAAEWAPAAVLTTCCWPAAPSSPRGSWLACRRVRNGCGSACGCSG